MSPAYRIEACPAPTDGRRSLPGVRSWSFEARTGQSTVGRISLVETPSDAERGRLRIVDLAVAATSRRKGIGLALLGASAKHAARLGAPTLHLEVDASNLAARTLYEKYGFYQVELAPLALRVGPHFRDIARYEHSVGYAERR